MKQYIDKAAIVAEIKRYKHKADERLKIKGRTLAEDLKDLALQNLCENLIHTIDTLEVKKEPISEDLEEAARRIATRHSHITGDTYYSNDAWFFKKRCPMAERADD